MATALVTGATAGIGFSYAQLLANEGFDLVLVARDLPRLNKVAKELAKAYGIKAETLKADLTKPSQLAKVEKRLASNSKPIEVLINNAGFGIKDSFVDSALVKEQELLDILVTAPMRLTHSVLPQMLKRDTNIKVSALCPGFTRTEFHARGKMKMTGLPNYMWLTTDQVVRKSWRDVKAGKVICIPGLQYLILCTIARIAPRPIVRKAGINVRRKQRVK